MGKEPSSRVPLYARYPVLGCVVREVTDDHLELQVRIVLIQAYLVVLCRTVVGKEHRAPFNVEYAVRRGARYRGEDTAVSTGEAGTAAQTEIRSLILPHRKDCEVIRPLIRWGGQTVCDVAARLIRHHEVEVSVGADLHGRVCLVIQLECEWQRHCRIAVVAVTPDIGIARHDRVGALSYDVLARRTTLYRVIP